MQPRKSPDASWSSMLAFSQNLCIQSSLLLGVIPICGRIFWNGVYWMAFLYKIFITLIPIRNFNFCFFHFVRSYGGIPNTAKSIRTMTTITTGILISNSLFFVRVIIVILYLLQCLVPNGSNESWPVISLTKNSTKMHKEIRVH
jgi:hypothetical protein